MKRLFPFIVTFTLAFSALLFPQRFLVQHYDEQYGLTTDLTKAFVTDSEGFLWIASDDGLLRFDGLEYTSFRAGLPSQLVKFLLKRQNNDLIAVTDLGILRVSFTPDTTIYTPLIQGASSKTDTTVWYPRSAYETTQGVIWISEPTGVVRYENGKLTRYAFPEKDISYNFLRSFQLFENQQGRLFALSYSGGLFVYDQAGERFTEISLSQSISQVASVIIGSDNTIYIGASEGVFAMRIVDDAIQSFDRISEVREVSSLAFFGNKIAVGSWVNGMYLLDIATNSSVVVSDFPTQKINALFVDTYKNIWVSTDNGVSLLRENFFNQPFPNYLKSYIHGIDEYKGKFYVTDGEKIVVLTDSNGAFTYNHLVNRTSNHILQVRATKNGLWFSNSKGIVAFRNANGNETLYDLSGRGFAILYMSVDKNENIWITQEDRLGLMRITETGVQQVYDQNQGVESKINVVRQKNDGTILAAGRGNTTYLYSFNQSTNTFTNISKPLPHKEITGFEVHDFAYDEKGNIWLATSHGLFKQNAQTIEEVPLGTRDGVPIRSVVVDRKGALWLGTTVGLWRYDGVAVSMFTQSDGLPSKTITARSLRIDYKNRLWFGTSKGVGVLELHGDFLTTPTPYLYFVKSNDEPVKQSTLLNYKVERGSLIEFTFISPVFPGNSVFYQVRIPGVRNTWSQAVKENRFSIADLPAGEYTIEVRAMQQGNYSWSKPLKINLVVIPHWYEQWWAILIYMIVFFAIIRYTANLHNKKLIKEKARLEAIIDDRTREIRYKNKELEDRNLQIEQINEEQAKLLQELKDLNATKDKFFSIISHDLKNPFTALMGFAEILSNDYDDFTDDERREMIFHIFLSAKREYSLLENLLLWSRAQRGIVKAEPENLSLSHIVSETLALLTNQANNKQIEFVQGYDDRIHIYADKPTITTVIRNLVSNAIKFTPEKGVIRILASAQENSVTIQIEDTGIGIGPNDLAKLFRIDVHHTTEGTNKEKGTGLGLILCKEFVELNHGSISVTSKIGEGSRFTIVLPQGNKPETQNKSVEQEIINKETSN